MFSAALLLLLAAGCVKCEQLTQPASVTVQPGQRLTITCQVSYSVSSYYTNWIRQPAGKGLEWIGAHRVGYTPSYKASLKNKFSISSDSSSKTVKIFGEQLTQPASVTVQPGQRLTITCQVSYSLSSYWTGWIRQPAGKGLEWIGWKYTGDSDYKDSLKNKFSISLDSSSNTVTLNGVNVQPEDTAVYYCARHNNTNHQWS
ncbi:Immunoglobulin heavy variable 5-51 [Takifugu flavidus]|nr:Immunoglobulin heavy variable 5-51 [Takifugu flavidus]